MGFFPDDTVDIGVFCRLTGMAGNKIRPTLFVTKLLPNISQPLPQIWKLSATEIGECPFLGKTWAKSLNGRTGIDSLPARISRCFVLELHILSDERAHTTHCIDKTYTKVGIQPRPCCLDTRQQENASNR
jgi:hypothetical protein